MTVGGILDATTYLELRDSIIKAAVDQPQAVVVDISGLRVPRSSAYAAFTSARWQISRWPEVALVLVCMHPEGRHGLRHRVISRSMPVYASLNEALEEVDAQGPRQVRRRATFALSGDDAGLQMGRAWVTLKLLEWSHDDLIPIAKVVVTELVTNVLVHTASEPVVRLEATNAKVTIAVEDDCPKPAVLPDVTKHGVLSGLHIVSAMSRGWGSLPTPTGKAVWATICAENRCRPSE
jgi:anti-anti-sigma regulatory factor